MVNKASARNILPNQLQQLRNDVRLVFRDL